jgi:uncharacterized protein (TIGR02058 family)
LKRFVIEFGMGADFHGQDVNKAAEKAIRDAISRSCLCGLDEVLGLKDFNSQVLVKATIAVSEPEKIDVERMKACFPIGQKEICPVKGGLTVPGLFIPEFGDKNDTIEAALACIEVGIINKGRE